jgi:hypothetical protein
MKDKLTTYQIRFVIQLLQNSSFCNSNNKGMQTAEYEHIRVQIMWNKTERSFGNYRHQSRGSGMIYSESGSCFTYKYKQKYA